MEVCVEYIESAVNAESGGGVRLELCSALSEGGLTPSVGLLKIVKRKVKIPVCVMIRPRTGNDFIYSDDELAIMEKDIEIMNENGADGFVFGVLNGDGRVDRIACQRLLRKTAGKPVTFHRAFDMTENPMEALEDIIGLGFKRILTSGQESSADKGSTLIKRLIETSKDRIVIIPGCGVNSENLLSILGSTGAVEFHATARSPVKKTVPKSTVQLGHVEDESLIYITDVDKVKKLVGIYEMYREGNK